MARGGIESRAGRTLLVVAGLLFAGLLYAAPTPGLASTTEQRDYVVTVDGKEAGRTHVSITGHDDGTVVMAAKASLRVNKALFTYTYDMQLAEWWKSGHLVGLKVHCNDNGKKTDIAGSADGKHLRLRVNAQERLLRPDVWSNSFWKLADARFYNKPVPVLDLDTGREYVGQLQYVGNEDVEFANQVLRCARFRVSGGPLTHELWFDEGHRLVRQEFVEQGRRVVVLLHNVRR